MIKQRIIRLRTQKLFNCFWSGAGLLHILGWNVILSLILGLNWLDLIWNLHYWLIIYRGKITLGYRRFCSCIFRNNLQFWLGRHFLGHLRSEQSSTWLLPISSPILRFTQANQIFKGKFCVVINANRLVLIGRLWSWRVYVDHATFGTQKSLAKLELRLEHLLPWKLTYWALLVIW